MKQSETEHAWEDIVYELVSAQEHAQKGGYKEIPVALVEARGKAHALRHEMAVMAKMIDIHKTLIIELLGNDSAYAKTFMKDWREQAEAELKGAKNDTIRA